MNMRNAHSKFGIGKQKFLCSLKPPMANPLKLSESQTRAKFTQFQRDNPKESQVVASGTVAVPSYRDHMKIQGYAQNSLQIKNQFMEVKKTGTVIKKILLIGSFENKKFALF